MSDFDEAIDRLVAGLEKKRVMNAREREIVAYHEAGHALVATALPGLDPVHKISIVQRGFGALGYTMQLPLEDKYLMTRTDLLTSWPSCWRAHGRGNRAWRDLDRRAERFAAGHGHRPRDGHRVGHERQLGAINYAGDKRPRFLELGLGQERGLYAEETARLIDAEVKRIMTEAHDSARSVLTEQRQQLEAVTRRLLEREVMEGDELRRILGLPAPEDPAPQSAPPAPANA